jgi:uncharacterized cupin superfamily protein
METTKLLLKAEVIAKMEGQHKIHFLNPNAERLAKSLGDAVGLQNIGVHLVAVEPGKETTEYHKHYYEEECVYILSGSATLIMDDERHPIARGDFVGFPRDTAHTIINDGDETLVYLLMGQRLDQDVADYPDKAKRLYRNSGRWDLVDIEDIETIRK